MKAVLSEKGQVTIPKKLRVEYGLEPGTVLDFVEEEGAILVRKVLPTNPVRAWRGRGKLPGGTSVEAYLGKAREGA
jgi:AbrB family looped-hinge helix DNA binding protein